MARSDGTRPAVAVKASRTALNLRARAVARFRPHFGLPGPRDGDGGPTRSSRASFQADLSARPARGSVREASGRFGRPRTPAFQFRAPSGELPVGSDGFRVGAGEVPRRWPSTRTRPGLRSRRLLFRRCFLPRLSLLDCRTRRSGRTRPGARCPIQTKVQRIDRVESSSARTVSNHLQTNKRESNRSSRYWWP